MEKAPASKGAMPAIPKKLYFRIGEVSDLVGVKPYVLRYWESEFPDIKPSKSKSGQRLYKRRDVELLLRIRQLLYEERFTINGARKRLKEMGRGEAPVVSAVAPAPIEEAPRQLEAFPPEEAEEMDEEIALRSSASVAPQVAKTLAKVKRDLQELLGVLTLENS